jgi:hypothetical protein
MLRKLYTVEIHILARQKDHLTVALSVVVLGGKRRYIGAGR